MISIIIPVYNASKYLRQCLDSLKIQSYHNWEAFLMDDGSIDDSAVICRQYSEQDNRFKLFSKKNEGVSKTRNRALDLCSGKYLFFLDADDYLLKDNCLEILREEAEKNQVDLVRFEYCAVDQNNARLFNSNKRIFRKKYNSRPISKNEYCTRIVKDEYFLCLNLLRNDIVQQNNIRFLEKCRMREDAAFLLEYLNYSKAVVYLTSEFYAYRKHIGAATSNILPGKYASDISMVFDSLYSVYKNSTDDTFKQYLEIFLSSLIVDMKKTEFYTERFAKCEQFRHKSVSYQCMRFCACSNLVWNIVIGLSRIWIKFINYVCKS